MPTLKEQLHALCLQQINGDIIATQQAIADAREASANETKSSAGDKYETAREMMQQEADLASARLAELQKLKAALTAIDPAERSEYIRAGSLAVCNTGNYYLSAAIGKIKLADTIYYALSPASPLGSRLMGLRAGESVSFNGKELKVKQLY